MLNVRKVAKLFNFKKPNLNAVFNFSKVVAKSTQRKVFFLDDRSQSFSSKLYSSLPFMSESNFVDIIREIVQLSSETGTVNLTRTKKFYTSHTFEVFQILPFFDFKYGFCIGSLGSVLKYSFRISTLYTGYIEIL